jgi:hypothetical protein
VHGTFVPKKFCSLFRIWAKFGAGMFTKTYWVSYLGISGKFIHYKASFTDGRKRMSVHTLLICCALLVRLGDSYRHIVPFGFAEGGAFWY